jgi:hypothetical protein
MSTRKLYNGRQLGYVAFRIQWTCRVRAVYLLSKDTAKVQADLCRLPQESKTNDIYICTIASFSVATLFVTLRVIGKVATKRLAKDDWVIVSALCIVASSSGCIIVSRLLAHHFAFCEHLLICYHSGG